MPTHCVEIYHITCQFYVDRLCLYYELLNLFTFHYYLVSFTSYNVDVLNNLQMST